MPVKNLVRETFTIDPNMLEQIKEAQKVTGIVSKSEMYRQILKRGLEQIMQDGKAV